MSVTHILDFVCDAYTGNFERELVTYVFAQENWEFRDRDYSQYLPDAVRESLGEELEDLLEGRYDEYGYEYQSVERVQFNGEEKFSVQVRISEREWDHLVTPELIAGLKARATEFFSVYVEHETFPQAKADAFLGILHRTVTTVESEAAPL